MKLTLTFDNGPNAQTTRDVLRTLQRAAVPASFFLIGTSIEAPGGRELLHEIVDGGHFIGNHSYSHTMPLGLCDAATAVQEIASNQRTLADCGIDCRHFRPFGGGGLLNPDLLHRASVDYLQAHKMTCVTWNCVPRDWDNPDGWPEVVLQDMQLRDWSVVVLHDRPTNGMANLAGFIDRARDAGAEFVHGFPPDCCPVLEGRIDDRAWQLVSTRID